MIVSPSHLGGKQDVYIGSEKSNTTRYNELGVSNKEIITKNRL